MNYKNFAFSLVATAPSPAASGTSLVVSSGEGAKFPATPFYATVWPDGSVPSASNAEIIKVTNITTDTLTIEREQEGTSARTIVIGDNIVNTITADTLNNLVASGSLVVDTNTLVVNAAGYTDKVGIGTATPAGKLDIKANNGTINHIVMTGDNTPDKLWEVNVKADGDFDIAETGIGSHFHIEFGGNVGIGTSTPAAKLQVAGSVIIANAGYIGSASDTDAIQIEADGDVVLSQDLTVVGDVQIDGISGFGTGAATDRQINVQRSGAKTATDYGMVAANLATSSTASINKTGLYVESTGTWNGSGADNYAIYSQAIGGTNNYSFYGVAGAFYNNGTGRFTGLLTLDASLVVQDGGYIGSASDTDAIQIEADGDVVLSQDLTVNGTINTSGIAGNIVIYTNDTYFKGRTTGSVEKELIGVNAADKVEIDGDAIGTVFGGSIVIPNDGYIGSVQDPDAIQIREFGTVAFSQKIEVPSGGYIGSYGDSFAIKIESSGDIVLNKSLYVNAGLLTVGVSDTGNPSQLTMYGGETGQHEGGSLNLYTSADYDATIESWWITPYDDDLSIRYTTSLTSFEVLKITAEKNLHITEGNLVIPNFGLIGSASDQDAIRIEDDGDVVLSQDLAVGGNLTAKGSIICHTDGRSDFGAGYSNLANARAAQDAVGGKTRIIVAPTTSGTNDYFSFSGLVDGQRIMIINATGCVDAKIDTDPIDKSDAATFYVTGGEGVEAVYDATLGQLFHL